jgi:hypothetical protein
MVSLVFNILLFFHTTIQAHASVVNFSMTLSYIFYCLDVIIFWSIQVFSWFITQENWENNLHEKQIVLNNFFDQVFEMIIDYSM